jgi:hypothetical protein
MIENFRTGSIWNRMMASREIRDGLSGAGFTPVVSIPPGTDSQPHQWALGQNYPNPFNPRTEIQLKIEHRGLSTVKVYDLLGREVAVLMNEVKEPGTYSVEFDGGVLASGVYLYQMTSGSFTRTRKMILLK